MDYQGQETNYMATEYQSASSQEKKQPPNAMATASLVMGILALVTFCCCYGGMIFGGLGILFALLSRGDRPLEGQAKTGMILSIIGLALGIMTLAFFLGFGLLGSAEFYQELPDLSGASGCTAAPGSSGYAASDPGRGAAGKSADRLSFY